MPPFYIKENLFVKLCSELRKKKRSTNIVRIFSIILPFLLEKCVSFEKSVSFCEDPVDLLEGKHSPQPTGT